MERDFGPDPERLAKFYQGLVELALLLQGPGEENVGCVRGRIEPDPLARLGDRRLIALQATKYLSLPEVRVCRLGIEPREFAALGERLVVLAVVHQEPEVVCANHGIV